MKKSEIASDLKSKGYIIDKATLGRFGLLLAIKNQNLLAKNPDLLLAASNKESTEEMMIKIEKEKKN